MAPRPPLPETRELRYGALLDALASLVGPDHFEPTPPTFRGLSFRDERRPGIAPRYDLFLPSAPSGATVVLVHGGGFVIGSRGMKPMRFLASRLVREGVAVASVDYRMLFRGGGLDAALDDVRTAFRAVRARSPHHGLDPDRVSLLGLSAGGALAMLVASEEGPAVFRLVCGFGLYEIDHLEGPLARTLPSLLFGTTDRAVWHRRSPRHAPPPIAPTLLLHGTADGLVPVEQARRIADDRARLGLPTRLLVFQDAPHGFFNRPCDAAETSVRAILDHLGVDAGERSREGDVAGRSSGAPSRGLRSRGTRDPD